MRVTVIGLTLSAAIAGGSFGWAQGNIGPDAFGYRGSDTSVGVPFLYEDITATGTVIFAPNSTDDVVAGPFPIGFTFNFYGTNFTTFSVDSNGYISFTPLAFSTLVPAAIPTAGAPDNMIVAFWTDISNNTPGTGPLVFQTLGAAPNRRLIVQWQNWRHHPEFGLVLRFQIKLFEGTNVVEIHYDNMINRTAAGILNTVIGIENAAGTDGLMYRSADAFVIATTPTALTGTAVRFSPPNANVPPTAGTVLDGTGADITIQETNASIAANWSGFVAGSAAITSYEFGVGTTPGATDKIAFFDVGLVTTFAMPAQLDDGSWYYVAVRAVDANGNRSPVAFSSGVRVILKQAAEDKKNEGLCGVEGLAAAGASSAAPAALLALATALAWARRNRR